MCIRSDFTPKGMPQECPLVYKKLSRSLKTKSLTWFSICLLTNLTPTPCIASLSPTGYVYMLLCPEWPASSPILQNSSQSFPFWGSLFLYFFSKYISLRSSIFVFFYSFKSKWREQAINSITSFEKCHAVHEKGALPNVKLRGWDALEWNIPAIPLFGTSCFFSTGTEALVKRSAPLFMKALPEWFGTESPCKTQFSEKM